jgi:hypothetical protein
LTVAVTIRDVDNWPHQSAGNACEGAEPFVDSSLQRWKRAAECELLYDSRIFEGKYLHTLHSLPEGSIGHAW